VPLRQAERHPRRARAAARPPGSLVAYALRITDLDPIKHKLLFERFLNPERISMPDIDLDFDERRRGDMIRYATEKYGEERVSQIITYGTIKAKAAVKDAARVLGFPYAVGDKITKAMPPAVMGKDVPLAGHLRPVAQALRRGRRVPGALRERPEAKQVVDTARGLEGLKRQWGVHAAGVILCREPLLDVIPIHRREQDGAIITQFDMGACETLGLLKMDFLGLRNLTVLDDCLRHIAANRGETVVLEELDEMESDPKTYELLRRGDTLGVFQLDGGPMRSLLRSMQPDRFESISAVLALYRPGPMGVNAHNDYADRKTGRKPVVPIHPELGEALEDILGDTYGLIVYQEQVMAIAQQLAGYTLGAADLLRRAMGKKKREILDKEYIPFSDGMKANGFSEAAIKTLWDTLVPFADYAFNRAHTAGYGLVSFWTAYLKANYPAEYMAALLTSVKDDKDKSAMYLAECRRMGIKVLPPDVNDSDSDFTPAGHRHPLRPVGDPQRRHERRRLRSSARARPRAASRTSPTSCARSTRSPATRRPSSRCARPGPSTRSATAARAWSPSTPRRSTPAWTPSATRPSGSSTCSAAATRTAPATAGCSTSPCRRGSGRSRSCSPTSGRCSGCTSRTTRCSASSTSWPARSTCRCRGSPSATTAGRSSSAASCPASPAR
jgi:DNA-directed DNA polymerase III PolC